MIIGFADKEIELFWQFGKNKAMPPDIQKRAFAKLQQLNAAANLDFLRVPPSNYLEKLSGNRQQQYSIRVNQRWRICFVWRNGDADQVEFVDYH